MAVADPMAVPPMQVSVTHHSAMAVVTPVAVSAMHLHEQIALRCSLGNERLRRGRRCGCGGDQRRHPYDGSCQSHFREHGSSTLLA